ncbi:hypothetical protein ACE6H2_002333 [Prunus campanulata]
MMIGCWNIIGASNKRSLLAMQDLKYRHKFDMLVILEPRISSSRARKVISQVGFPKAEISDVVGFSGISWIFTAVYGHPCPTRRSYLWQNLSIIAASWNLPWVVCGDSNDNCLRMTNLENYLVKVEVSRNGLIIMSSFILGYGTQIYLG